MSWFLQNPSFSLLKLAPTGLLVFLLSSRVVRVFIYVRSLFSVHSNLNPRIFYFNSRMGHLLQRVLLLLRPKLHKNEYKSQNRKICIFGDLEIKWTKPTTNKRQVNKCSTTFSVSFWKYFFKVNIIILLSFITNIKIIS